MSVINMVKNIKDLFSNYVLLIKIGNFYEVYNNDANIISYLFNYKIKTLSNNNITCWFPLISLNKVKYILDKKYINYLIIDKSHNYEEIEKNDFKKKNKYNDLLNEANLYIDKINRINKIKNYLLNDSSKLVAIERLIYEW